MLKLNPHASARILNRKIRKIFKNYEKEGLFTAIIVIDTSNEIVEIDGEKCLKSLLFEKKGKGKGKHSRDNALTSISTP